MRRVALTILACIASNSATGTNGASIELSTCAAKRSVFINEIAPYDIGDGLFTGVTIEVAGLAGMDLQGWSFIFYDTNGFCVGGAAEDGDADDDGTAGGGCPITPFFTKSRYVPPHMC